MMNIVDSSGWLEYFAEGENAAYFTPAIEDLSNLLVPVICVYEVFKRILLLYGLDTAEVRMADLYKGKIIELDAPLGLSAAKISVEMKLPMADSILLATTRAYHATLWTQDEHFNGIEGVRFIRRK
jgi:predicted nucleic acid-binding protein